MGMPEDVKCKSCGSKYFMGYRNCMCVGEPQESPPRYSYPENNPDAEKAVADYNELNRQMETLMTKTRWGCL